MYFQASEYKRRNFLNLNNDNNQPICSTYSKDGTWLKHIGLSNLLCAHVSRIIYTFYMGVLSSAVHTGVEVHRMDLWNDLGFSLCAALSVCCVVATSDDGEKI